MPMGVKAPISSCADCQFAGMSDCGGVSSKHSADGIGGVCHELVAVPGRALKLCAGVEKLMAPSNEDSNYTSFFEVVTSLPSSPAAQFGRHLATDTAHLWAKSCFARFRRAASSLCN